jgi:hypothetical protein
LTLKLYAPEEPFSDKKGSGVDIPIVQVKIGLNFRTCKAEFGRDVWAEGLLKLLCF